MVAPTAGPVYPSCSGRTHQPQAMATIVTVPAVLDKLTHPLRPAILFVVLACGPSSGEAMAGCPDPTPWRELVTSHLERYPGMDMADALKLLQQATTGSEHAVDDSSAAVAWMQRELATMGEGPREPMIDTLGASGRFARVHLRPFRDAGGDPDLLTGAFVATSHLTSDTALLACALHAATDAVPWDSLSWHREVERWRSQGYPAMHHSDAFTARYRPAYRVVEIEAVPRFTASP